MTRAIPSHPAGDLSVRVYRGEYPPHSHPHSQVLIGLRGSLALEVDGRATFVDPSCGLVIPAGVSHGYMADTPTEVLVVDCDAGDGIDRLRRFAASPDWACAPGSLDVARVLDALRAARTLQARRRLDVAALARRVDAALHRDWTLDELAAASRFSPQRFRARFAELTGMSPIAWLRGRRLDEAARLLREGRSLEAVAPRVGYASASALSFALRRDRGASARGLRRDHARVRASLDN